jgi:hypothetical protein
MRQILIGLLIILMLRFRPEGIFRERPGVDRGSGPAVGPGPGTSLAREAVGAGEQAGSGQATSGSAAEERAASEGSTV